MSTDIECSQEKEIRHELGEAMGHGNMDGINRMTAILAEHRRACLVCNGTGVKQFFAKCGALVLVREYVPAIGAAKEAG